MQKFELLGVGNAVVDAVYEVDEVFIKKNKLQKGIMTLIDENKAESFYSSLDKGLEIAGGSVANSTVCFRSLSGRSSFIGKIKDDILGKSFSTSLLNADVFYSTEPSTEGPGTARCFIFVTPDAQRTMNTYIGACSNLTPKDINEKLVKNSKIIYLEGYCWEESLAKESLIKAAEIAHRAGNKVSLTLSDPFCVERHRQEFLDLIKKHVDILFANEVETQKLFESNNFEESAKEVAGITEIAALTLGEKGAKIYNGKESIQINSKIFGGVKDTTGAGDSFAAGFLYGLSKKFSILRSGNIAAITAGEIISHFGARPETSLLDLMNKELKE